MEEKQVSTLSRVDRTVTQLAAEEPVTNEPICPTELCTMKDLAEEQG